MAKKKKIKFTCTFVQASVSPIYNIWTQDSHNSYDVELNVRVDSSFWDQLYIMARTLKPDRKYKVTIERK